MEFLYMGMVHRRVAISIYSGIFVSGHKNIATQRFCFAAMMQGKMSVLICKHHKHRQRN